MIPILRYVFLGILIYAVIIPIMDQIVVVIIQALELLKGNLLLKATLIQNQINEVAEEDEEPQGITHAIGFQMPEEVYYEEEEDEDNDE